MANGSSDPMNAEALRRGALALHADHRTVEAAVLNRQRLDQDPGHAGVPRLLAIILIDGPAPISN